MRCKACDSILGDIDLKARDPFSGEHFDLCTPCRSEALAALYDAHEDTPEILIDFGVMPNRYKDFVDFE